MPSLSEIATSWGKNIATSWIAIQLRDLSEFAGCKDKLTIDQIDQTAKVIYHFYKGLKPSDLMLFFLEFKSGKYGKFFGTVDGMTITEKLGKFVAWKNEQLERINKEQQQTERQREIAERDAKAMTYNEWVKSRNLPEDYRISKLFKNGVADN